MSVVENCKSIAKHVRRRRRTPQQTALQMLSCNGDRSIPDLSSIYPEMGLRCLQMFIKSLFIDHPERVLDGWVAYPRDSTASPRENFQYLVKVLVYGEVAVEVSRGQFGLFRNEEHMKVPMNMCINQEMVKFTTWIFCARDDFQTYSREPLLYKDYRNNSRVESMLDRKRLLYRLVWRFLERCTDAAGFEQVHKQLRIWLLDLVHGMLAKMEADYREAMLSTEFVRTRADDERKQPDPGLNQRSTLHTKQLAKKDRLPPTAPAPENGQSMIIDFSKLFTSKQKHIEGTGTGTGTGTGKGTESERTSQEPKKIKESKKKDDPVYKVRDRTTGNVFEWRPLHENTKWIIDLAHLLEQPLVHRFFPRSETHLLDDCEQQRDLLYHMDIDFDPCAVDEHRLWWKELYSEGWISWDDYNKQCPVGGG